MKRNENKVSFGTLEPLIKELGNAYDSIFRFHDWTDDEARSMVYSFEGDPTNLSGSARASNTSLPPPELGTATSSINLFSEWFPRIAECSIGLQTQKEKLLKIQVAFELKRNELINVLKQDRDLALFQIGREVLQDEADHNEQCIQIRRKYALTAASLTTQLQPSSS